RDACWCRERATATIFSGNKQATGSEFTWDDGSRQCCVHCRWVARAVLRNWPAQSHPGGSLPPGRAGQWPPRGRPRRCCQGSRPKPNGRWYFSIVRCCVRIPRVKTLVDGRLKEFFGPVEEA